MQLKMAFYVDVANCRDRHQASRDKQQETAGTVKVMYATMAKSGKKEPCFWVEIMFFLVNICILLRRRWSCRDATTVQSEAAALGNHIQRAKD